jgi:hypothetical protein
MIPATIKTGCELRSIVRPCVDARIRENAARTVAWTVPIDVVSTHRHLAITRGALIYFAKVSTKRLSDVHSVALSSI